MKVNLYNKYASSFYGSNLWNLFCNETEKVYSAYNISIRQTFRVPFNTHRYLIQPLIPHPHIKTQLCSKFIKFVQNNETCKKSIIRLLSAICKADNRTVYCSNIFNIAKQCNIDREKIDSFTVKNNMIYYNIPAAEEWRIDLMHNLIYTKLGEFTLDNFEDKELTNLLQFVCTS